MTTVLLSRDREVGFRCAEELQKKGARVYLCHQAESAARTIQQALKHDATAFVVFYAASEEDREYWQQAVDGSVRKRWIKLC